MKKMHTSEKPGDSENLRSEYRFNYRKARPNRFAGREKENRVVVLDADIAQVFTSSEAVNNVLRALISTMPPIEKHADVD